MSGPENKAGDRRIRAGLLALLAAATAVAVGLPRTPPPLPADAPAGDFSATRAMALVREMARRPHPVGSEDHERVLGVVADALRDVGLSVEEQAFPLTDGLVLTNLRAVRKGTEPGPAIYLVSHYDSRETGPGAGDAAASVASIVETMRALGASPPLRRDVVALVTDGEEQGLLGARAFLAEHPEALGEIGIVLNFEGRGCRGPSFMFQTGEPNGDLVRAYGAAATFPAASSLTATVYRRMPNDTDFTVFLRAGRNGMNFAFIDGYTAYHTPLDTPENLDLSTLQHHGGNMLAVVRTLAEGPAVPGGGEVVYFDLLGRVLVRYPRGLAIPFALIALGAFAFAVRAAGRRGLLRGFLATGAAAALSAALAFGAARAVLALLPGRVYLPVRGTPEDPYWFLLLAAAAVALFAGALRLLRGAAPAAGLAVGALGWWALLAAASAVALPGASYLFTWPLLFAAAGRILPGRRPVAAALLALPGVLLVAPTIHSLLVGMGLSKAFVGMPLVVLLAATAVPAFLADRS